MYIFEELVKVIDAKSQNAQITYLDFLPVESTGDYPELKMGVFSKFVELSTHRTSSMVSLEQINDLEKIHGVGMFPDMGEILANKQMMGAQKEMVAKIAELGRKSRMDILTKFQKFLCDWTGYIPKNKIGDIKDISGKLLFYSNLVASRSRRDPANFAIVSNAMGSYLQDSAHFVFGEFTKDMSGGSLYKIGQIGGLLIYVDPFMKYNDWRVFLGRTPRGEEPGLYYIRGESSYSEQISVDSELRSYKLIALDQRRVFAEIGIKPEAGYMEIEFTRKYNFFRYLLEKIGILKNDEKDLFR